jgi:hypothetical protein
MGHCYKINLNFKGFKNLFTSFETNMDKCMAELSSAYLVLGLGLVRVLKVANCYLFPGGKK